MFFVIWTERTRKYVTFICILLKKADIYIKRDKRQIFHHIIDMDAKSIRTLKTIIMQTKANAPINNLIDEPT